MLGENFGIYQGYNEETCIVSFFGEGRLRHQAEERGIKCGLIINTKSQWYAPVLMFMSVQSPRKVTITASIEAPYL